MPHPVLLGILALDVATVVLLVYAGWRNARFLIAEGGATPNLATGLIAARLADLLFLVASLGLLLAVAAVLPGEVKGAMCGAGVVRATGGLAERALGLRLLGILLLGLWRVTARVQRRSENATVAPLAARFLLLAIPVVVLGVLDSGRAIFALDGEQTVDCCGALYKKVQAAGGTSAGSSDALWFGLEIGGGIALGLLAATLVAAWQQWAPSRAVLALVAAVVWTPSAAVAFVRRYSDSPIEPMQADCFWCLLTAKQQFIGYGLLAILGFILAQSIVLPLGPVRRKAAAAILIGLAAYIVLATIT